MHAKRLILEVLKFEVDYDPSSYKAYYFGPLDPFMGLNEFSVYDDTQGSSDNSLFIYV